MTVAELEREVQAEQKLSEAMSEYVGQWVAVRDHEVVAAAESLPDLLEAVAAEKVEVESVFRVEDSDTACFF